MDVLLIGPPGSGKGTQGQKLAEHLGKEHIAVGDLLRAEVEAATPLGKEAADLMRRGELVPDQLVIDMLRPRAIAAHEANGFVLDGFPRTLEQAEAARNLVDEFFKDMPPTRVTAVVYLDVPRADLIKRLLARAEIEGRPDDTQEVIENRLELFYRATLPLVDYYRGRGMLRWVTGTGTQEEVLARIMQAIGYPGLDLHEAMRD